MRAAFYELAMLGDALKDVDRRKPNTRTREGVVEWGFLPPAKPCIAFHTAALFSCRTDLTVRKGDVSPR